MASRRRALRWGVVAAVLVFAATLALSLFYAKSLPSKYTGSGVVQFSPKPTKNGGVVGGETVANSTAGYVAYLGAPATLQAVARTIGTEPATLKDGLEITLVPATTTVSVDYTATGAADAAEGANAMMSTVVTRAKNDPLVTAAAMAQAAVPINPSGPQRLVIAAAGLVLGLLLAAIVIVFVIVLPARLRSSTDGTQPDGEARTGPRTPGPAVRTPMRPPSGEPNV